MNLANLLPTPHSVAFQDEWIDLGDCAPLPVEGEVSRGLQKRLMEICGGGDGCVSVRLRIDAGLHAEGYNLSVGAKGVDLTAAGEAGFLYGLDRMEQMCVAGRLRCGTIQDFPALKVRGFHINFGGLRHLSLEDSLGVLQAMRRWNLNTVLVEYGSRFPHRRHPHIPTQDALRWEEIQMFVRRACDLGIEVIPLQQCLGHVQYVLRCEAYAHLREEEEKRDQWCPLNEASFDLFRELVDEMIEAHPGVKTVHLGGDETRRLGACPRCAVFVKERGKGALYLTFVSRAVRYVADQGLTPIVWDDMICHYPEILDDMPRDLVIMYWDYWTTRHPSAVFVARPEGRGVVVDRRWKGEWAGELDETERRMIASFTAAIDFEHNLSEDFRQRFGPYLGEDFPRRVRAFPYLEFYQDRGFRVIGCGAGGSNLSLWHGMPDFPRYMDNIAIWSQRAAEAGALGVVTSAWYDFPTEALMPGVMCTGQTAWNPRGASKG